MRRLTLGLLVLGGGLLLSLPFRRASEIDPASLDGRVQSSKPRPLDDDDIRLLVREVTQDVEVPVLFDPHTDYLPAPKPEQVRHLPLTYEDLAVPVDRDPFYENRFNAALQVAQQRADSEQSKRLAKLERIFEQTPYVDQSIGGLQDGSPPPRPIAVDGKQWLYQQEANHDHHVRQDSLPAVDSLRPPAELQLASSDNSGKIGIHEPKSRTQNSILAPLPPPDQPGSDIDDSSSRHWIQQPD